MTTDITVLTTFIIILAVFLLVLWYKIIEQDYKIEIRQRILIFTMLDNTKKYIAQYKPRWWSKWLTYNNLNAEGNCFYNLDDALKFCEKEREHYAKHTIFKIEKHYI